MPGLLEQEVDIRNSGESTKMNPVGIHLLDGARKCLDSREWRLVE